MSPPSPRADRQAYYAHASAWADDTLRQALRSRTLAWRVAALAGAVAFAEALALMLLAPLKTVEPITLLVDRHTGYVQELKSLDPRQISAKSALTESFLTQYVIAREGFDWRDAERPYRQVALWSAGAARDDYLRLMSRDNPVGPIRRLGRDVRVTAEVRSVSAINAQTAMVRFATRRRVGDGLDTPDGDWVAIIEFRYAGEPAPVEQRRLNPLGFQVVRYTRSQEAPTHGGETP